MKSTKAAVFILMSASLLTTACSLDDKLVGEWQSNTVHLTITKGASVDGYHDGFSWTWNGGTHTQYWLIRNEDRGTILYLSSGGPGGMESWGMSKGFMQGSAHKVIELTSDKLVFEWNPDLSTSRLSGTYEFHRVK